MEPKTPERVSSNQKRNLNMRVIISVLALWVKQASRASKKMKPTRFGHSKTMNQKLFVEEEDTWSPRSVPPSPLRVKSKEILTKAMTMMQRAKHPEGEGYGVKDKRKEAEEECGLWQKTILMGGKCQPLDFSGVIYYDSEGRQLKDVPPRSPRASPVPPFLIRN